MYKFTARTEVGSRGICIYWPNRWIDLKNRLTRFMPHGSQTAHSYLLLYRIAFYLIEVVGLYLACPQASEQNNLAVQLKS
ncbi:hypothetical protein C8R42DRAFT_685284 [Lentinula raphanica]|nr:hypothetical protein C8R42DRAFT_685284 [Lentinula raphanica]